MAFSVWPNVTLLWLNHQQPGTDSWPLSHWLLSPHQLPRLPRALLQPCHSRRPGLASERACASPQPRPAERQLRSPVLVVWFASFSSKRKQILRRDEFTGKAHYSAALLCGAPEGKARSRAKASVIVLIMDAMLPQGPRSSVRVLRRSPIRAEL